MEKTKRRKISIPEKQYQELELFAKKHDLTVDQLADQLLEKEIVDSARKEIFSPGLKWGIPKNTLMMARVPKQELPKLHKWLKNEDKLKFLILGDEGELTILNETELSSQKEAQQVEKRIKRKVQKIESTAP